MRDDDEGLLPAVPNSGEPHPEGAIAGAEPRTLLLSFVDAELLPQGEVFKDECTSVSEE